MTGYADLVKILNDREGDWRFKEAADAIEALVKERDDEIERRQAVSLSLEAADAEAAKLKEALTRVQTAIHDTGNKTIGEMLDALAAVEHISRRALGEP